MNESRVKLLSKSNGENSEPINEMKFHPVPYLTFDAIQDYKSNIIKITKETQYDENGLYIDQSKATIPPSDGSSLLQKLLIELYRHVQTFIDFDTNTQLSATCLLSYGRYPNLQWLPNMYDRAHRAAQICVPVCDIFANNSDCDNCYPSIEAPGSSYDYTGSILIQSKTVRIDLTQPKDMFANIRFSYYLFKGKTDDPICKSLTTLYSCCTNIFSLLTLFTCCSPCIAVQALCCCGGAGLGLVEDCRVASRAKSIKARRNVTFRKNLDVMPPTTQVMIEEKFIQNSPLVVYNSFHGEADRCDTPWAVAKNNREAIRRIQFYAPKNLFFQLYLALSYKDGKNGIVKDPNKAVYWYLIAMKNASNYENKSMYNHELKAGQYYLGSSYEKGEGTEKNLKMALSWYKRSARKGYEPAIASLQRLGFPYRNQPNTR